MSDPTNFPFRPWTARLMLSLALGINDASTADALTSRTYQFERWPLSGSKCQKAKITVPETGDTEQYCPGPSGYGIKVIVSDGRSSVEVVGPDRRSQPLNYWDVITPKFSHLAGDAEWVLAVDGRTAAPVALIVTVAEGNAASWLTVTKIAAADSCVVAKFPASKGAPEQARDHAKLASTAACLKEKVAGEITAKNWKTHPSIVEIRDLYTAIEAAKKNGQLKSETRSSDCPEPYVSRDRTIFRDGQKKVRMLVDVVGSDDSVFKIHNYYDGQERLRFLLAEAGAVNESHSEYRLYFDPDGAKRLWEDFKLTHGPGYTFPRPFPAEFVTPRAPQGARTSCAGSKPSRGAP